MTILSRGHREVMQQKSKLLLEMGVCDSIINMFNEFSDFLLLFPGQFKWKNWGD